MNIQNSDIPSSHRTDQGRLYQTFLSKVLPFAAEYYRCSGYFSSNIFDLARPLFIDFFERGGRYNLVVSANLSAEDVNAIYTSFFVRPKMYLSLSVRQHTQLKRLDARQFFIWSLMNGYTRLRIAVSKRGQSVLYHEKLGCLIDDKHNAIAFNGSANETRQGWVHNFECIDVFPNWTSKESEQRCRHIYQTIKTLHDGYSEHLDSIQPVYALQNGYFRPDGDNQTKPESTVNYETNRETIVMPADDLYAHQKEAVNAWLAAQGHGILEMATGSGKTFTALTIAQRLLDGLSGPLTLVVAVPYRQLIGQWEGECKKFGLRPLKCTGTQEHWYSSLKNQVRRLRSNAASVVSILVTNKTLLNNDFQREIQKIRGNVLFVGDECHNLGSEKLSAALPANANLRLGLSATPMRWFDEEGTEKIHRYFGSTIYSYSLYDGIRDGVLVRYYYYPHIVELTHEEFALYEELTGNISRYWHGTDEDSAPEKVKYLLIKRARIVANAEKKLGALLDTMASGHCPERALVYCGDGYVDEDVDDATVRHVDAVRNALRGRLQLKCGTIVADTPAAQRDDIIHGFSRGLIQAIVAVRCLDEGVDIPPTQAAYILASSSNPRQFVQRRGRVLRRSAGKTHAEIHDYVVSPPMDLMNRGSPSFRAGKNLIERELRRAAVYASDSENRTQARHDLLDLVTFFRLHHVWGIDGKDYDED